MHDCFHGAVTLENLSKTLEDTEMDINLSMIILISIVGFLSMLGIIHMMSKSKEREQTKREIAAYVAEGSMTPEQGEALLNAGEKPSKG